MPNVAGVNNTNKSNYGYLIRRSKKIEIFMINYNDFIGNMLYILQYVSSHDFIYEEVSFIMKYSTHVIIFHI